MNRGVLVDCDGVLVDFQESVIHYCYDWFGFRPEEFHIKEYDMNTWHDKLTEDRIRWMLSDPLWYSRQPVYAGVEVAIARLIGAGYEPIIVTKVAGRARAYRENYLKVVFPDVRVLFSDDTVRTKARLAVENKLQWFVEDSRSESSSLASVCKEGFLVKQDYNSEGRLPWNVWPVASLKEAVDALL